MRRSAKPKLSEGGEEGLARYDAYLTDEQDLAADTVRNYLSDLRQFAAFCEASFAWSEGEESGERFSPANVTTPTVTLYRSHLKNALELKPASINRHLVSIKRYFGWATDEGIVARDSAKAIKLSPRVVPPPRHLSDKEEDALVAAVERYGTSRDRTLVMVALHTGLRAEELCGLAPTHVRIMKRSGRLEVWGKRGNANRAAEIANETGAIVYDTLPPRARRRRAQRHGHRRRQAAQGARRDRVRFAGVLLGAG